MENSYRCVFIPFYLSVAFSRSIYLSVSVCVCVFFFFIWAMPSHILNVFSMLLIRSIRCLVIDFQGETWTKNKMKNSVTRDMLDIYVGLEFSAN